MTILPGAMTPPTYERRIGERHSIGIGVQWAPIDPRRPRRRRRPTSTTTENVSLSGVGLVSTTDPTIRRGTPVRVTIGDETRIGTVRTILADEDDDRCYYGIAFEDNGPVTGIGALIEDHLRHEKSDRPAYVRSDGSFYSERLFHRMSG